MKLFILCGFALLGLLFLVGCKAKYKDISDDIEYDQIPGNRYQILTPLKIFGIKGYFSGDNIEMYIVSDTNNGFSGPEVVDRDILQRGMVLRVVKVLACKNCFEKRIRYLINILSENNYKNIPIHLHDLSITDANGKIELDPSIFKLLN